MYRIVCESYENYKKDFLPNNRDDYRYRVTKPLELVVDIPLYESEKEKNTLVYQKLEDLIYLLKRDIDKHPNFKSFLWSLESRGIMGIDYRILSKEDYKELTKIINMFLKLAYWN